MQPQTEFKIGTFRKNKDTLLGKNLLFSLLTDADLKELDDTVLAISKSGLARTKFVTANNAKVTAFKIHLIPKMNENIQVTEIQVKIEPISHKRFKNYQENLVQIRTHNELANIHATALFDSGPNLINFFCNKNISLIKLIPNKGGKEQLTNWLRQIFEGKASSEITLTGQETGTSTLKIVLSGFSAAKDTVCVIIESSGFANTLANLSEGLQFNKDLLNSIPADIALWNLDHQYLFLNENAMKNVDLRKWIIGKNDFDFFQYRNKPIEIALKRREVFNEVITSGKLAYLEEHLKTKDGDFHHLRILKPISNFDDLVQGVLGYNIDITAIKKNEARLLNMNLAVQDAMDGIALLNNKSEYIYVNEAHIKMFGYDKEEEFLGNKWHMLYNREEILRIEKDIFPIIAEKGRWAGETKGKSKKGLIVYQEITLTSLPDGGLVCICRDRTEYRENRHRIKTAEIISDKTNSIVMVTDANLKIQWVNNAFEINTGYSLEEVKGKTPKILHGPETNQEEVKSFSKKLRLAIPCSANLLNYTKSGSKRWRHISVTPVFDENNELQSYISVENDITELKNAELTTKNALLKEKELNELKSQFVSIASHEIRTPLASIQSSTDLIQMLIAGENIPKDRIKKHLDKISDQIFRLSSIMSNLLTIGKINLDKLSLNINKLDLENFIKKIIKDFFDYNHDAREIKFDSKGKKRNCNIDQVMMSQVLTNLMGNALKYSKEKPDPEVLLEYLPDNFRISIKDYGVGIPEDQIPHIYDSFFRARNVENIQGTGLGMVIVKKFVEMHNGKIEVKSIINQGTTFRITFPYT